MVSDDRATMSRMLNKAAIFVVGILIGASSTAGIYAIRSTETRQFFEQRLRCKELAETYAKKNSDEYTDVILDRNDFSKSRNSCIASVDSVGGDRFWKFEVVDVVTGELLSTDFCDDKDSQSSTFCGNGRDVKLRSQRDRVLDDTVK